MIPIENIKEGDYVYSYDEDTKSTNLNQVVKTFVHTETEIVIIKISDSEIVTTKEHPFWVLGKGWVVASKLQNDDNLWIKGNEFLPVLSIVIQILDNPVFVYNFEVKDSTHILWIY